ncbi:MAG: hypothetical protein IJE07_01140 [Clostridia bacterium]|nr:hypothetical protein [Clostridia bacterium]
MNNFITWCDERTRDCMASKARLHADGRDDEAAFMQIRANVYGIFRTVYTAVKGDKPQLQARLTSIPAAWETALAQAEQHGDAQRAHIERIKLEIVAAIRHYVTNAQEAKPHD